jgi:alkylation response protein AidB-like acyl-CoA dehydrogenase
VDFDLPADDDPRRLAVRAWLAEHPAPAGRELAEAGYVVPHWPPPWGLDADPVHQLIIDEEIERAGVQRPAGIGIGWAAPVVLLAGTDEQRERFLPGILSGEDQWCQLFSEPEAGSDLASLSTRAVRDGDDYVVDGSKLWTSGAHHSRYGILLARTDPDAPKHKGISIILVPTDVPGFSWTPIHTLGGERTNATYYENVRVPVSQRVGPENAGWSLITSQLNHERVTLACPGFADRLLEEVWEWALRTPAPGGGLVMDQEWVRIQLARAYAKLEALKVLNWRSAWSLSAGIPRMEEASAVKVMGTEFFVECYRLLLEIVDSAGLVKKNQPGALFGGLLEQACREAVTLTFGGGVNEVQRDIIAIAGLGLPRARRSSR